MLQAHGRPVLWRGVNTGPGCPGAGLGVRKADVTPGHPGPGSAPGAPLSTLWMDISKESCQNRAVEEEGRGERAGGLRLFLARGTEMEKTSAPGTTVWLHLRPAVGDLTLGWGGHPNLTQGPGPIGSLCRT